MKKNNQLTEIAIKKIKAGLRDIKKGRTVSLESYAKKRRINDY